ncbi:MAG: ComF family protein [Ruminococcaceae bacterium]|nr:ComF family protein [Oscillospiraceae bacterium]
MKERSINSFFALLSRLVCVPKCASCNERLSPFARGDSLDHGYPCLCDKCMEKWQKACLQMCHTCSGIASKCTCMPKKNLFVQPSIPSLFFYHPDTARAESKVIYTLKHKNSRDVFEFISEELCKKLEDLLDELEINIADCVLTYIPRTRKALIKNGFDQGEMLCFAMSRRLGAISAPLLLRRGGVEQKKLTRAERKKNAEKTIFANTELRGADSKLPYVYLSEILEKKTVILVEDVITTGATVERAIKCLKSAGAGVVLVCAVARCEVATDKKGQSHK